MKENSNGIDNKWKDDYFKDIAIELAWNLITKEFQIPKERLCVSVYSEDKEAFDLWKKIAGLPESKIYKISTSDNFWSMGDLGPCGPCSEIFYDHGDHLKGGPPGSKDQDGDRDRKSTRLNSSHW